MSNAPATATATASRVATAPLGAARSAEQRSTEPGQRGGEIDGREPGSMVECVLGRNLPDGRDRDGTVEVGHDPDQQRKQEARGQPVEPPRRPTSPSTAPAATQTARKSEQRHARVMGQLVEGQRVRRRAGPGSSGCGPSQVEPPGRGDADPERPETVTIARRQQPWHARGPPRWARGGENAFAACSRQSDQSWPPRRSEKRWATCRRVSSRANPMFWERNDRGVRCRTRRMCDRAEHGGHL